MILTWVLLVCTLFHGAIKINSHFIDRNHNTTKKSEPRHKKGMSRRNPGDCKNVDPGLDAFINANMLAKDDPRYGCQRKVLNAHFGNDRIGAF